MKKLFIIGGMGAGKSTARKALVEQGLPNIDLDQVGHWEPTARSTAARWLPRRS